MFSSVCTHEPDVVAAAAAGRDLSPSLGAHVASCASCRDAITLVQTLAPLANTSGEGHPLPDPAVIWWKGQILRRWEAERRVAVPVERMHRTEVGVGLASLAIFIAWQWAGLSRVFSLLDPSSLANLGGSTASAWSPNMMVIAGAVVALGVGVLARLHKMITGA